ncbi:MAG TPA: nuclear transport factor 2 family protein [Acidimicrobiales bacterium]|nr:nuclear transport factor 2 family protein [Acidimicrobiales bacterium]
MTATDPASALRRDDRQDIADVLVRYATGIDCRDWTLLRSCSTEDCDAEYGVIGAWRGADAITTWMRDTHEPCGHTMHRITNVAVAPATDGDGDGGPDPDRATARAYVDVVLLDGANRVATHACGYYDDELVRTPDGWMIARRRYTSVLVELGIEGVDLGGT